jgi:hypothetical protein
MLRPPPSSFDFNVPASLREHLHLLQWTAPCPQPTDGLSLLRRLNQHNVQASFQFSKPPAPPPLPGCFSLPRLHTADSRQFFRDPTRKPSQIRATLAIAISVCTIAAVGFVGLPLDRFRPQGLNPWSSPLQTAKSHLESLRSPKLNAA